MSVMHAHCNSETDKCECAQGKPTHQESLTYLTETDLLTQLEQAYHLIFFYKRLNTIIRQKFYNQDKIKFTVQMYKCSLSLESN